MEASLVFLYQKKTDKKKRKVNLRKYSFLAARTGNYSNMKTSQVKAGSKQDL